jgi:ATP-dependent Clp protease ATP-binding subunit ClpB
MMSTPRPSNNQMSQESYTEKAWDAIARLPGLASRYESQYFESEALLKSVLEDGPQGLANRIFFKAGVKITNLEAELENYLNSQPKVSGDSGRVSGPRCWGWEGACALGAELSHRMLKA